MSSSGPILFTGKSARRWRSSWSLLGGCLPAIGISLLFVFFLALSIGDHQGSSTGRSANHRDADRMHTCPPSNKECPICPHKSTSIVLPKAEKQKQRELLKMQFRGRGDQKQQSAESTRKHDILSQSSNGQNFVHWDDLEGADENKANKLCVLVPFRDRFEELQVFVPHMERFLSEAGVAHSLLILNQLDLYRFNRASLVNVGYYESLRNECNYMAMHDVDLLPLNPDLDYSKPPPRTVYHVASPQYHPRYNYTKFIGGILILNLKDFKAVNGMSNRYWGWGLEDDEFYLRLSEGDIRISRPVNLTTDRTNTFMHVHDRRLRRRDTLRIGDQKQVSRRRDRMSGLDTVEYEILSRTNVKIENSACTCINVQLKCNKNFSPWCEIPESLINRVLPR